MMMKAITIHQPWASLIACGAKEFETRSWKTSYRGPIAIHAGKKPFDTNFYSDKELWPFAEALLLPRRQDFNKLPYGCVIAIAELVECWHIVEYSGSHVGVPEGITVSAVSESSKYSDLQDHVVPTKQEQYFGDWTPGRYAWQLTNVQVLPKPIPAKGMQRLWNWEGNNDPIQVSTYNSQ